MTERSHTLAKVLFVVGWLGLIGAGSIYGDDAIGRLKLAALVRAELVQRVASSTLLAPAAWQAAARSH